MIHTYRHRNIEWLDLVNPTADEVRSLIDSHNVDPIVAEQLLNPTLKSKVDLYQDYIYLILHFPTQYNAKTLDVSHVIEEIDFIVGKDFIITTRYSTNDVLLEFSKKFETDMLLTRSHEPQHGGFLFYQMISTVYRMLHSIIEDVKTTLLVYEKEIFDGKEKEMVFELSKMNRVILNFKEALLLHKEILKSFQSAGKKLYGDDFSHYLKAIVNEYVKVENSLDTTRQYLNELRETNNSLLSTKQNEVMKLLAIVSFITFPLTLVSSIFGMNTHFLPFVGSNYDFEIVMFIMILTAAGFFLFFKYKKWI